MDITHDNVCSSMLSCFYSHLLSTGRPISSINLNLGKKFHRDGSQCTIRVELERRHDPLYH